MIVIVVFNYIRKKISVKFQLKQKVKSYIRKKMKYNKKKFRKRKRKKDLQIEYKNKFYRNQK